MGHLIFLEQLSIQCTVGLHTWHNVGHSNSRTKEGGVFELAKNREAVGIR